MACEKRSLCTWVLQMIFLNGSLSSVQAVLLVLREFDTLPGLSISPSKSSFYSSGLSQEEKDRISFSVGLYHGIFHVRYLGVPLCTKKLTLANWESLLHIIKVKINCWSVKSLSFAGRFLLLDTVIVCLLNFWTSMFVLAKKCIGKIRLMC